MNFVKKEKRSHHGGLFTHDGLRGLLEGKNNYAVEILLPFLSSFIVKSLDFEERCELSRMNIQYSDTVNKVLLDHRDYTWVAGGAMMLRSEVEEFKRVVKGMFLAHCSLGSYTLKFYFLQ